VTSCTLQAGLCNLSGSQRSRRGSPAGRLAVGSTHQLQTLVQKEPPGVGDFTLLPSSTGSHCSLLNRHRVGLTPAVPPRRPPRGPLHASAPLAACRPGSPSPSHKTEYDWTCFQVTTLYLFIRSYLTSLICTKNMILSKSMKF